LDLVDRFAADGVEVASRGRRRQRTAHADLREVEQLFDHAVHAIAALDDAVDDARSILVGGRPRERARAHEDRVERVPEIVGHHSDEQLAGLHRTSQLFDQLLADVLEVGLSRARLRHVLERGLEQAALAVLTREDPAQREHEIGSERESEQTASDQDRQRVRSGEAGLFGRFEEASLLLFRQRFERGVETIARRIDADREQRLDVDAGLRGLFLQIGPSALVLADGFLDGIEQGPGALVVSDLAEQAEHLL
jgi:hypothetical protein